MLSKQDECRVKSAVHMQARSILNKQEVIGYLRDVATADNLTDVLPLLPADLAVSLQGSLSQHPPLKGIGYWQAAPITRLAENDRFPNPRLLVCPDWCVGERERILDYLRAGRTYAHWRGFSYCLFLRCGTPSQKMGSRCLTDGEWVWPQGLPHYVEHHHVRLPDEFLTTVRQNSWRMPDTSEQATRHALGGPDVTFWVAWAKTHKGYKFSSRG